MEVYCIQIEEAVRRTSLRSFRMAWKRAEVNAVPTRQNAAKESRRHVPFNSLEKETMTVPFERGPPDYSHRFGRGEVFIAYVPSLVRNARKGTACYMDLPPFETESFTAILAGVVNWNTACVHYEINCALDH
jgi:hypothetical protein